MPIIGHLVNIKSIHQNDSLSVNFNTLFNNKSVITNQDFTQNYVNDSTKCSKKENIYHITHFNKGQLCMNYKALQ